MTTRLARSCVAAVVLIGVSATRAAAAPVSGGVLDLLRPGSHASLGLGGDPFLSPLDDDLGWWSRLGLGGPAESRATFDASRPIRLGGVDPFEGGSASWVGNTGGRGSRMAWSAGLGVERPSWRGGWQHSRGTLELDGSDTATEAAARVELFPGLLWQLAGAAGSTGGAADRTGRLGAGVRYRRPSGTGLQASWQRERPASRLSSTLYDQPIAVSANLVRETQRVDARWVSPWALALEGTMAQQRWVPVEAAGEALTYHVTPRGDVAFAQAGLAWRGSRQAALLRWTRFEPDLAGDLAWGGQRFGGLDYARADLDSWLLGFEMNARAGRVVAEVERIRLDASGRGEIESWPFTSTLADLLGQRVNVRGRAEVAWERAHVGLDRPLTGRSRGRMGVEWVELRPEGWLESWRPAFLVFGKVDERMQVLDVRRVQLVIVSLGVTLSAAAVDVDLGLEQCVFARVRRTSRPAEAGGVGDGSTASWPVEATETGTHGRLTLSRRF